MKFAAGIAKMTACTLMLSALFGCGQSAGTAQTEQTADLGAKTELNVFAAASMTETLNQIAENYKSVEPDVTLTFNFASSGDLLTQIKEGADCDIFISAAPKQMNELDGTLADDSNKNPDGLDELLEGTRFDMLENKVVLAVPDGNPKGIESFDQLAELLRAGRSFEEVGDRILARRPHMCQFFTVDDLNYLKRGGRISGAAALVGSVLGIKPILRGDETGHIVSCGKVRGNKKAYAELADYFDKRALDKTARIGIAHADNCEGTDYLLGLLRERGFTGECLEVYYEPVTGAHVGPGTVALFFYGTEK